MKKHYILSNFLKASKTFDVYRVIFENLDINHIYLPMEISTKKLSAINNKETKCLQHFLENFRKNDDALSIVVSNPFKQYIYKYCDKALNTANQMETINLIVKKDKMLVGKNIDGEAFLIGQQNTLNVDFNNKNILILGCGGVSTAIAFTLLKKKILKLFLYDILSKKTQKLKTRLSEYFPQKEIIPLEKVEKIISEKIHIIYNGTGVGKINNDKNSIFETPIKNEELIPRNAIAIDANYTPWKTQFLLQSQKRGCKILNGFSHMIAFTTLHLSDVLNSKLEYNFVNQIGQELLRKTIQSNDSDHNAQP